MNVTSMKYIKVLVIFVAFSITLSAQITKPEADEIVKTHLDAILEQPYTLFYNTNSPTSDDIVITTTLNETVKIKYASYAYFVRQPATEESETPRCRYLFVKTDVGNLLELITANDLGPSDMGPWQSLGIVEGRQSAIELYRSETGKNAGGANITGIIQYLVNADYLSGAPQLQTEGAVWHYDATNRRVFIDISNPSASLARLIERLSASDKAFIRPNA